MVSRAVGRHDPPRSFRHDPPLSFRHDPLAVRNLDLFYLFLCVTSPQSVCVQTHSGTNLSPVWSCRGCSSPVGQGQAGRAAAPPAARLALSKCAAFDCLCGEASSEPFCGSLPACPSLQRGSWRLVLPGQWGCRKAGQLPERSHGDLVFAAGFSDGLGQMKHRVRFSVLCEPRFLPFHLTFLAAVKLEFIFLPSRVGLVN